MIQKDSHIVITGATGFLGSYVLRRLLADGYTRITCTRRKSSDMTLTSDLREQVNWFYCNITDDTLIEEIVQEADAIIHIAAMVSLSNRMHKQILSINTEATSKLVDLALFHNVEKFVFVSSVAAFGMSVENEKVDERTEWKDSPMNNAYSMSKQLAEREVQRGVAEGLSAVIVNPAMIIGAGVWDSSTVSICRMVYKGLPFYPTGAMGVVDVRDVAKIISLVLPREDVVGHNFIASAENWTHKKLIQELSGLMNKRPPQKPMGSLIQRLGIVVAQLSSLIRQENAILNAESIKVSQYSFLFDNTKSRTQLDFEYRPVLGSLTEIVSKFLDTYPQSIPYALLDIE